jgi:hypothetical protein
MLGKIRNEGECCLDKTCKECTDVHTDFKISTSKSLTIRLGRRNNYHIFKIYDLQ